VEPMRLLARPRCKSGVIRVRECKFSAQAVVERALWVDSRERGPLDQVVAALHLLFEVRSAGSRFMLVRI
jgi:hypothetical protein